MNGKKGVRMEEIGHKATQLATLGNYTSAIAAFTEAIKKYPNEKRFYHNKAYCYYQINEFDSALQEAELLVQKFPDYARGYYRKAEILASMNKPRLLEAKKCYEKVIELCPNSPDGKELQQEANNALQEVKIQILKDGNRFSRWRAGRACSITNTLEEAKTVLESGYCNDNVLYASDEDRQPEEVLDPREDPANPSKCLTIWVGNIKKKHTETELVKAFSEFGQVKSAKCSNNCVFVNFVSPEGPSKAMARLQGQDFLGNKAVKIRYPDKAILK